MNLREAKLIAPCLLVALAACGPSGPPLTATDIVAVAPLPGRSISAAYLTLHNGSGEAIALSRISSPEFARVEIHESQVVDDVVRMRRLESIVVDAGSSTTFEPGAKHLMLIDPLAELAVGHSISLQFEYDGAGILIVTTPLIKRE